MSFYYQARLEYGVSSKETYPMLNGKDFEIIDPLFENAFKKLINENLDFKQFENTVEIKSFYNSIALVDEEASLNSHDTVFLYKPLSTSVCDRDNKVVKAVDLCEITESADKIKYQLEYFVMMIFKEIGLNIKGVYVTAKHLLIQESY